MSYNTVPVILKCIWQGVSENECSWSDGTTQAPCFEAFRYEGKGMVWNRLLYSFMFNMQLPLPSFFPTLLIRMFIWHNFKSDIYLSLLSSLIGIHIEWTMKGNSACLIIRYIILHFFYTAYILFVLKHGVLEYLIFQSKNKCVCYIWTNMI